MRVLNISVISELQVHILNDFGDIVTGMLTFVLPPAEHL
jgi:hypothetical protein